MNLKSILCGLSAIAMLTACSNDEPGNDPNKGQTGNLIDAGYLTVGIEMPQTKGSRANNDSYDHGLSSEYKVNNAMLLIFTGATEAAATFHSAYDLTMAPGGVNGDSNPDVNITTSYLKTVHLHNVADSDNIWGLVLVNYNGVATCTLNQTVQTGNKPSDIYKGLVETLSIGTNSVTTSTTFNTLRSWTTTYSFTDAANGFFMTNAVLSTNAGETNAPTADGIYTLQNIGIASNVTYNTEAEAVSKPAASFYVERAVAKATLTYTATPAENIAANNLTVKSIEWLLDNTEPSSYIVRNVGDNTYVPYLNNNKYRFVGGVKIGQTAVQPVADLYRHYWAIDPQYNAKATLTTAVTQNMANSAISSNFFKDAGVNNPQYCHENTFDVANMSYQNSTRAILKVTFNAPAGGDGNLYVVNNLQTAGNIFKSQSEATSNVVKAILESHDVRDAVNAALKPNESLKVTADDLDITFTTNPATNVVSVASVAFKDNDKYNATPATFNAESNLVKNVNATFQVVKYDDCVAYYDIRFKHFGDEYTPWTAPAQTTTSTAIAYPGYDAQKFLGRWGMVRNNWYELNIQYVKNLGKPVIGNLFVSNDDTPDDNNEVEKWLSFKINILSWAKRVQNEDL